MRPSRSTFFTILIVLVFSGCATIERGGGTHLTGTWRTETPVPYVIEPTVGLPHGLPLAHEALRLVERHVQLEFELVERSDGIVLGTNRWVVYDENLVEVHRGEEPVLGAHQGPRIVLVESADEVAETAQIVFELSRTGGNRLGVIGYNVGSDRLIAIRAELVRAPKP